MPQKPKKPRTRSVRYPNSLLETVQDAANETGLPIQSVRDLIERQVLPVIKFDGGRRLWIRRRDLDQVLEQSRRIAGE